MRDRVLATFRKWLLVEDDYIDVLLAAAASLFIPGELPWLMLVGAAGSCKTEPLRAFGGAHVIGADYLTKSSLISGRPGIARPIDLDGKLLIVKDFGVVFALRDADREGVFSALRSAYDGEVAGIFGSGAGHVKYRARFQFIGACTLEIERFRSFHSLLGERFLYVRPRVDTESAVQVASDHAGQEVPMRREMSVVGADFMDWASTRPVPAIPEEEMDMLRASAQACAVLRTPVRRDHYMNVVYEPEAEVGTRLVGQMVTLAKALHVIGRSVSLVRRVARDTAIPRRVHLVSHLVKNPWAAATSIADAVKLPPSTTRIALEDLYLLGVLLRRPVGREHEYALTPAFETLYAKGVV